jgi:hypothetical protein
MGVALTLLHQSLLTYTGNTVFDSAYGSVQIVKGRCWTFGSKSLMFLKNVAGKAAGTGKYEDHVFRISGRKTFESSFAWLGFLVPDIVIWTQDVEVKGMRVEERMWKPLLYVLFSSR